MWWQLRAGVAFRSAFPGAGYLYIPAARCDERSAACCCRHATRPQRICDTLAHHRHQPAAHEALAAIIWRLHCSLSRLEQLQRREHCLRVI
ncbi:hypothetical protein KCP74_18980 [Salmonella enterica subsp. enterica]|nr:hypothetical protein KCP74_18980 [Salmonella enterica subsp. enterica]